jgi:hypothetical protein
MTGNRIKKRIALKHHISLSVTADADHPWISQLIDLLESAIALAFQGQAAGRQPCCSGQGQGMRRGRSIQYWVAVRGNLKYRVPTHEEWVDALSPVLEVVKAMKVGTGDFEVFWRALKNTAS